MSRSIDELFELPPGRFIAARDGLAKHLTEQGDVAAAAEVKALRKPTLIAWALNQLTRLHREELEALLEAGGELRSVQRKALSGISGEAFRAAAQRRRKLVQELTNLAMAILGEAGRGPQGAADEIGRTLDAASSDPDLGELLLLGQLSRPIAAASGFEAMAGLTIVEDAPASEAADRSAREASVRNAERQAEKASAEARRARMRADTLAQDLEELSRRAEEAGAAAERLEREAEAAQRRLEAARGEAEGS